MQPIGTKKKTRRTWWMATAGLGVALAAWGTVAAPRLSAALSRESGAEVHGSLSATLPKGDVPIPDLTVRLQDPGTDAVRASTRADLTGHFTFRRQPPGRYKLCWAGAGFAPGCGPVIGVAGATVWVGNQTVTPLAPFVSGTVLLRDGGPCYGVDPFLSLNAFTRVWALSGVGSQLVPPVRANSRGQYVIGGLPRGAFGPRLRTVCEGQTLEQALPVGDVGTVANFTVDNARPKIAAVAAFDAGQGIRAAAPGATVELRAEASDPDGNPIHYRWRAEDGAGSVVSADAPSAPWSLPSQPGVYTAHVLARDDRGGYAAGRVSVTVASSGVVFSGTVVDAESGAPVGGAAVEVNGKQGKTGPTGTFFLPGIALASRYVLNVRLQGYALLSRIFDDGNAGGVYRLQTAQVGVADPNLLIDITDRRKELERHQRRGVRVLLPPGTLDTSAPVVTSLSTVDPSLRPMPGDYRAIDAGGADQSLVSFGALFAEFRDQATGKKVNVAPGRAATLFFPVAAGQVGVAPPAIPLWTYDEVKGIWREEGKATLQSVGGALYYVGETKHFSTINTDVAQGGAATCLRVRVDPTQVPAGITLRVHIPTAPSYKQVQETALNGDQFHAIFRLPKNDTVTLELIDSNGNVVPGATQVVDLSLRPPMVGTNLWPPYPYSECGDPILMGITMPAYAEQSQGHPYFLTGPYGTFNTPSGVDADQMTDHYYGAIDPSSERDTLGHFWTKNGFTGSGGGGTRAAYTNFNDLGFGRDMHCRRDNGTGNVACYVSNYGFPDQNPGNSDAALLADTTKAVATVAMEYSPIDGSGDPTKVVKFYAFQGGQAAGARIRAATLDAFGPKPIPQLCTVCHGGNYNPIDYLAPAIGEVNLGSKFREFDLQSFRYPPGGALFPPTVATGQGSLQDFKDLNDIVKTTLDSTTAIWQVIDRWYAGGGTTPDFNTPIAGWAGSPQDDLYRDVYALSCRTCHAARDGILEFNTFADFRSARGAIQPVVCGPNKVMPNAVVTYKNFWQSIPSRPAALAAFSTSGWAAFGTCQ